MATTQSRTATRNVGDISMLVGKALEADRFDLVVSIFGAMFAPKPFDVAREMVRVTKPGGRIVMGNWIPNDPTFVSELLKICTAYMPPPPEGFVSPMRWGVENDIIERFGQAGVPAENITMERDTYYFTSPDKSPAQMIRTTSAEKMRGITSMNSRFRKILPIGLVT